MNRRFLRFLLASHVFVFSFIGCILAEGEQPPVSPPSQQQNETGLKEIREPDVIYVPTPYKVVEKMLELAKVKKTDVVYDLGCGDGRIVVTAALKYGCKGYGFDIDPTRVLESRQNVKKYNVGHLVKIEQKDIFKLDLSKANVVTLYLLPELNVKLIPQLETLKPGSRIVSHDFDMKGVKPDKVIEISLDDVDEDYSDEEYDDFGEHKIYLWTIPLKKEKKVATD